VIHPASRKEALPDPPLGVPFRAWLTGRWLTQNRLIGVPRRALAQGGAAVLECG
jgi:hypothetical protein